ncbi:tRNA modification GTPase gtpbp3, mitochondrial [Coemansia brasiliensis]|uniref:tRNA modification GTPase gtpbp3, mitochondrial n=1 Tax=Coemansia brasiliensis TaxID=2650707 RepID=A0A9W8LZC8_9FUNG|nr:tRNA modification GTPase gtpbp3, mitochondrial [Coemansia brasiliensis]
MVKSRTQIEAIIDFSAKENIEDGVYAQMCQDAYTLAKDIFAHLNDRRQSEIMCNGVALSIVGPSNPGKGTILNKRAQRQVAIAFPIAGTIRDIVEATSDTGGYPLVVSNTAGMRATSTDIIEQEGIRRAVEAA